MVYKGEAYDAKKEKKHKALIGKRRLKVSGKVIKIWSKQASYQTVVRSADQIMRRKKGKGQLEVFDGGDNVSDPYRWNIRRWFNVRNK